MVWAPRCKALLLLAAACIVGQCVCNTQSIHACENADGNLQPAYAGERDVCFIIRTVAEQPFESILFAIFHQVQSNAHNVRAFLVVTDGGSAAVENVTGRLVSFKSLYLRNADDAACTFSRQAAPDDAGKNAGSFGYPDTDAALDVLASAHEPPCKYVIVTNGDNYYSNQLLLRTAAARAKDYHLIGFDFSTHHLRNERPFQRIDVGLQMGSVDLGSFMLKFDVYRDGHRFMHDSEGGLYAADWSFVDRAMRQYGDAFNSTMVHEILMFHQ